jgi:tetratricopeptide (TPR) repeat protein
VSVGLQLEKLEELLCETTQDYCDDSALVSEIRSKYEGLLSRTHHSDQHVGLTLEELGEIIDTLKDVLNSSPRLPPPQVACVHSTIGLVRQLRGEKQSAINSFMKALWIATATHNPDAEEIGLIVHRIGIAHSRNGNYNESTTMLEKALAIYRSRNLGDNHPYVVSASQELAVVSLKLEQDLWQSVSDDEFFALKDTEAAGVDHEHYDSRRRLSS